MENDAPALPTPERLQHGEVEIRDIEGVGKRASVRYDRRIDKYHAHGQLGRNPQENDTHYKAAVDYLGLVSSAMPRHCQSTLANLHRVDTSHHDNGPDRADAMVRLVRLHRALGPQDTECLLAIVYEDRSADGWIRQHYIARGKNPPRRSEGIFRFRNALRELARHWGL